MQRNILGTSNMDEDSVIGCLLSLATEAISVIEQETSREPDVFPREQVSQLHSRWDALNTQVALNAEIHPLIRDINNIMQSIRAIECQLTGTEGINAYRLGLAFGVESLMQKFRFQPEFSPKTPQPAESQPAEANSDCAGSMYVVDTSAGDCENADSPNFGAQTPQVSQVQCIGEHTSSSVPLQTRAIHSLETLKAIPGVVKAYLSRDAALGRLRVAVAVTDGLRDVAAKCPAHLDDGTSVLLVSPYDREVPKARREARGKDCERKYAGATFQKALDEWRERVNFVDLVLEGEIAIGPFFFVVAVYAKGFIPEGEDPYPVEYEGFPVYVVEGRMNELAV